MDLTVIKESIHSFFPSCKFMTTDSDGSNLENLGMISGLKFRIRYNDRFSDLIIEVPMVIDSFEMIKNETPGMMVGTYSIALVHEFFSKQVIKNDAKNDTISSIISSLVSNYFGVEYGTSKQIDDTQSQEIWYRNNLLESEFIKDVLVPNASSPSSRDSIFYAYIGLDNTFNFKSHTTLLAQDSNMKLTFKNPGQDSLTRFDLLAVSPFTNGLSIMRPSQNKKIVTRNEDGTFTTETIKLKDKTDKDIPILANGTETTDFAYLNYDFSLPAKKASLTGRKNNLFRSSFSYEKLFCKILLNTDIRAGYMVEIEFLNKASADKPAERSAYISGYYLVEEVSHSWLGSEKKGYTEFIVSRKDSRIPNTFKLRDKLL